ncbi:MAG: 30S ribosomal protein S20 [Calditrichae bacterium]|nr:30S ribosomal protein S20 [Calditrichota bacterium]MCB9059651.1 30S ribosomal protein S20 [Calditrichia bacterium]
MAHHKSALKRIKTSEKSRQYNKRYTTELKNAVKSVLGAENKEDATPKLNNVFKLFDKLVHKNILHKNKAANQKSRLNKHVNALS